MTRTPLKDDAMDRHWRSAVLWTIHDLRLSIQRRRRISLSNLNRLFEYRWRKGTFDGQTVEAGADVGKRFLASIYPRFASACSKPPFQSKD